MQAYLFSMVTESFLSLISGKNIAAIIINSYFRQEAEVNEKLLLSDSIIQGRISIMVCTILDNDLDNHPVFNKAWKISLFNHLCFLANEGYSFIEIIHKCMASVDYLRITDNAELEKVRRANFDAKFTLMYEEITSLVQKVTDNFGETRMEFVDHRLLNIFRTKLFARRFLRWGERVILSSFAKPIQSCMTEKAQRMFVMIRQYRLTEDFSDDIVRDVCFSLDACDSSIWEGEGDNGVTKVSNEDMMLIVSSLCQTLQLVNVGKWAGKLSQAHTAGLVDGANGVTSGFLYLNQNSSPNLILPAFQHLGDYAFVAQVEWESGKTVGQSILDATQLKNYTQATGGNRNPNVSNNLKNSEISSLFNSSKNTTLSSASTSNVTGSSSLQYERLSINRNDSTQTDQRSQSMISSPFNSSTNTALSSANSSNYVAGSSSSQNERVSINENDFIQTDPRGQRILAELSVSFKKEIEEFDSIDEGLTGIVDAKSGKIAAILNDAFDQNKQPRERTTKIDGEPEWIRSMCDSNVLLVALSYTHQTFSQKQRLNPATIKKISMALSDIAKDKGKSKINIWVDSILSKNKNNEVQKGLWAVRGLYPYLVLDVVRIIGNDEHYDDGDCMSMWMCVEDLCCDETRKQIIQLENETGRGYSFINNPKFREILNRMVENRLDYSGTSATTARELFSKLRLSGTDKVSIENITIAERMMFLAREIVKGALLGKNTTWKEDKKKLLLWSEFSMISGTAKPMSADTLKNLVTLRLDQTPDEKLENYVNEGTRLGFNYEGSIRNSGRFAGNWLGVMEIFPGLSEVSSNGFRRILPCVSNHSFYKEKVTILNKIIVNIIRVNIGEIIIWGELREDESKIKSVCVEKISDVRSDFEYAPNGSTKTLENDGDVKRERLVLRCDEERKWIDDVKKIDKFNIHYCQKCLKECGSFVHEDSKEKLLT